MAATPAASTKNSNDDKAGLWTMINEQKNGVVAIWFSFSLLWLLLLFVFFLTKKEDLAKMKKHQRLAGTPHTATSNKQTLKYTTRWYNNKQHSTKTPAAPTKFFCFGRCFFCYPRLLLLLLKLTNLLISFTQIHITFTEKITMHHTTVPDFLHT